MGAQGKLWSLAGLMGCLMSASSHTTAQMQLNVLCNWRYSVCVCEVSNGEKQRASQGSKALCLSHSLAPTTLPQLVGASREILRFHRACGRRKSEGAVCPCEVSSCLCFCVVRGLEGEFLWVTLCRALSVVGSYCLLTCSSSGYFQNCCVFFQSVPLLQSRGGGTEWLLPGLEELEES